MRELPRAQLHPGAVPGRRGADTKGFFFDDVLHVFRNPETGKPSGALFPLGALRPWIVAGYAFIWVCIFLIIYKGVGVVGKVVMWTVPLPLVLLGVLFFSEIGRLGAIDGIRQYLTPDFSHLTDPDVWRAAFGQVFFSLTLGFGVMIAYASYLKRKSDITNNALITTMANCGTSFFAGFVIFSTVGYLAMAKGQTVLQTAGEGGALAFIIYPDAIRRLGEYAPLFGGIFFLMLLLLGIDSAFSLVEGAASALVEKTGRKHAGITAVICVIGFSVGLVFCTRAGGNWVDWANHICNDIGLPLVMLLQCIVAGWLFGAHRIQDHINEVSELRVGRWWTFMIRVVCPLLIGGIFVATTIGDIAKIRAGKLALGPYIGQWCLLLGLLVISVLLMVYRRRKEVIE